MAMAGSKAAVVVVVLHHLLEGADAAMYNASEKWQSQRVSGNLLQYQVKNHVLLYDFVTQHDLVCIRDFDFSPLK